jgi:hypothetical protein
MKIEKINELFARFAGQLLKMRWITLGIFALVIIVSVIGMKRMVKETSFDDYFIEDDPMLVMKNVQTEHSTTIVVKNSQYNVKVDKALFTVAKLEKGL